MTGARAAAGNPLALLLLVTLLAACTAGPRLDATGTDARINPREAVRHAASLQGQRVLWGGVVVQGVNRRDHTVLEVLAYPLRGNQRPDTDAGPLGRFVVEQRGYLETVDYAPGRTLTLVGRLDGTRAGKVGETEYIYPAVIPEQLHLWPVARSGGLDPRVHIGVGVIFH